MMKLLASYNEQIGALILIILHKMLNTHHIKFKREFYMSSLEMFSLQFIMRLMMQNFIRLLMKLDESRREQMAFVIRFVDRSEFILEYFFGYIAC
jgi:predicted nucleic-acid-binding protein